jgi:plasmid stabilization system protein ParE
LQQISDYLAAYFPRYRQSTLQKLYSTVQSLRQSPHRGRPGAEMGTREILFPPLPYVAVYRLNQDAIEVLRIYHGSQDR